MEGMKAKEFVVLSGQRSGSTLLVRSLDESKDIFCAGEIFHPKKGVQLHHAEYHFRYIQLGHPKITVAANSVLSRSRVTKHLDYFFSNASHNVKACGFKLMKSQLDWNPTILPFLKKRDVELMILIRKNDFETALSLCRAKLSGTYHSDEEESQLDPEVPFGDFQKALNRARINREYLENCAKQLKKKPIVYEDLAIDWKGVIEEVGTRLGIENLKVPMALRKLGNPDSKVLVSNISELKERFGEK